MKIRDVFCFQEYSSASEPTGIMVPLIRIAIMASVVVIPLVLIALYYTFLTLPFFGYIIGASLLAHFPLIFFARNPHIKIGSDFRVVFRNQPGLDRALLKRSLIAVLVFTMHAVLYGFALFDKVRHS